jgi:hypothetical protein
MLTRFIVIALASGGLAGLGWMVGRDGGLLVGFLIANLGFAVGWYYGRKFLRQHLDF